LLAEQADLYKKFTRDTIVAGIANVALGLRGLILLPILSKTLGADAYGVWSQIQVTIPVLALLATLQLGLAMNRFLAGERDKNKISQGFFSVLAATSLASALFSALMFVFAEPLAAAVFGGAKAAPFIKLASLLVLLTAIDQVMNQYFVTARQTAKYSFFIIGQVAGEIVLVAYLVFSGFGLYGVISAILIIRAFMFIAAFLVAKTQISFSAPSLSVIKPYLIFSLPLIPAGLSSWIYNLSDRYVIGYFLGIKAVGIYSAAYNLAGVVAFFVSPLVITLLPAISYFYENNKIQEVKTHLKYSLKFYLMLSIPAVFGLSILAKPLLATLTTAEFITGFWIVPIVVLAQVFLGCATIVVRVPLLFKRTKVLSLIIGSCAAINVIMNIILVPVIGILGAAISTLVTFMIYLIATSIISFRQLSFEVDWKFIAKSIASSLVTGAVVWILKPTGAVSIVISIIAGAIIYFAVLMLLRGFTRQEYSLFKDILKGLISKAT
jgi:O-antigen/teichoic acid export membrane protein